MSEANHDSDDLPCATVNQRSKILPQIMHYRPFLAPVPMEMQREREVDVERGVEVE